MRKNRKMLFLHRDLIRGRYLKDDQPGGGGGTPAPSPAPASTNGTGLPSNSGTGTSAESGNNNTGESFDPASFWQSQDQGGSGSSESESASGDQPGSGTEFKDQLTQQLNSLNFGDPVMTPEIAEAFQNGDFTGFQTALNASLQQAVRQSLALSVSVLRPFAEQIMTQVRDEITQTMGQRDDNDQLVRDFPAAKDKMIRPVVQQLYTQALKNTKGDRTAAVNQVKEMMRLMSTSTADDLRLNVAPRGADDSGRPSTPTINWLDELSARE